MSALDRPTAEELARGAIAAAVRNGEITPQEADLLVLTADRGVVVDTTAVAHACSQAEDLGRLIAELKGPDR